MSELGDNPDSDQLGASVSAERKCKLCEESTGEHWIECIQCEEWHHKVCADVSESVDSWMCPECIAEYKAKKNESRLNKFLSTANVETVRGDGNVPPQAGGKIFNSRQSNRPLNQEPEKNPPSSSRMTSSITFGQVEPIQMRENTDLNAVLMQLTRIMVRQNVEPLPEFTGEIDKWPVFYAQYKNTKVHLTNEENMQRLRNSVKGEAFKATRAKLSFSKDPEEVIAVLRDMYGRADVAVRKMVAKLRSLPAPEENSASSIRSFKNEIEEVYVSLVNLEATTYLESPTLVDDVLLKMPVPMKRCWGQYAHGVLKAKPGQAILQDLVKWLDEYSKWTQWETFDVKRHQKSHVKPCNVHVEASEDDKNKCWVCQGTGHILMKCSKFLEMSVEQRWEIAKSKNLCFCCLNRRHKTDCQKRKKCGVAGCTKFHHQLLHSVPKENFQKKEKKEENKKTVDPKTDTEKNFNLSVNTQAKVHFRIVPVKLFANDKFVTVNAFFDEGSSQTLLSKSVADKLGIKGTKEPLSLTWTDNTVKVDKTSEIVSLKICGIDDDRKMFLMRNVRTVAELMLPTPTLNVQEMQKKYDYMKGISIPSPLNETPAILIGLSDSKLGIPFEKREGSWDQPIVTRTRLGWVIHGSQGKELSNSQSNFSCVINSLSPDEQLHDMVKYYFTTESFGVSPSMNLKESSEDVRAKELLNETKNKIENGYEIGLLWRSENLRLPDNRDMVFNRYLNFEKQMKRDPEFGRLCHEKFMEHLGKGFYEELKPNELKNAKNIWYLPMFAVKNPNKPGKIRFVFDAAAKFHGVCLNDVLLKGPDLLKNLLGILFRFREEKVAITSDITDMFPSVKIRLEDQYAQLIFYRMKPDEPVRVFRVVSMTQGTICAPSLAQFVKNSNAEQYEENYPEAVKCIKDAHYMDDVLDSLPSEELAIEVAKDVQMIHANAGFKLKRWISNSTRVMQQLNSEEVPEELSLQLNSDTSERILGMYWNIKSDTFTFKLNFARIDPDIVNLRRIPTKREVLKTYMSVFDPMGLLTPIVLNTKTLLQRIWREGYDWDQKVSQEIFEKWSNCMHEMKKAENVKIPRLYGIYDNGKVEIELHTFSDAGEEAFAAVSYLRFIPKNGPILVAFVASKCKVAPLKHLTIPRLELQGALMAARLATTVINEHRLKILRRYFWTDSQTVMSWIKSDHRRYKQFVATRVSEILDHTTVNEWNWIPSKLNVADDGTKPKPDFDMTMQGRWFGGPEFLKTDQKEWKFIKKTIEIDETEEEMKHINVHIEREKLYSCIDPNLFSSWHKLVKYVAYVMRMIQKKPYIKGKLLEASEINYAEKVLFKKIQYESFPNEYDMLMKGNACEKGSRLNSLSPIMNKEEGLIRMKGRIDAASYVSNEFKRPIILDRKHKLVELMIMAFHVRFFHANTETVVAEIRKRFWVIEIRVAVRNVIKNCQHCKNEKAKPQVPEMSPLPDYRLMAFEKPFSYVGVDYFGPITVTVGRRHEKRWVAIFVCLVVRAVHIEIVSSLNTSSCIMATRNFMLRRGPPKLIFCDNATSFHGTESELRRNMKEIDRIRLQNESSINLPGEVRTKWKFNTPLAPHMAGVYERMVKSIKKVLYSCLHERYPSDEILRNFLMEAEYSVNSRPLTYQSIEPDTLEPLTPNLILQHGGQIVYSPGVFNSNDLLKKSWRYSQQLADQFWKRWVREYLPVLTKRTKWFDEQPDLIVGDIVVIVDESAPRNLWKKGIVEQVHPGIDNKVRSATVRTSSGVYKRPVIKLPRLDVRRSED